MALTSRACVKTYRMVKAWLSTRPLAYGERNSRRPWRVGGGGRQRARQGNPCDATQRTRGRLVPERAHHRAFRRAHIGARREIAAASARQGLEGSSGQRAAVTRQAAAGAEEPLPWILRQPTPKTPGSSSEHKTISCRIASATPKKIASHGRRCMDSFCSSAPGQLRRRALDRARTPIEGVNWCISCG